MSENNQITSTLSYFVSIGKLSPVFVLLQPRQNLLSAAGRIGEASHDIMKQVGDEDDIDKAFQVKLFHPRY